MADPRRTGPCGRAGGDQEQGEACQTKGGCSGQGDRALSGGCSGGGGGSGDTKCRFRTKVSCGRSPSAHGGSDSQGATCASCRHAGDLETSQCRVDRRAGVLEALGTGFTAEPSGCDKMSDLHLGLLGRPSYSSELVKVSLVVILGLCFPAPVCLPV